MILLTREEAEMVLGLSPTHPGSALEPAPLKDGTYVLPEDILDDPSHADVHNFLAGKVVPGDPDPALSDWDEENPDDVAAYEAARLTWSDGGQQREAVYAARNA